MISPSLSEEEEEEEERGEGRGRLYGKGRWPLSLLSPTALHRVPGSLWLGDGSSSSNNSNSDGSGPPVKKRGDRSSLFSSSICSMHGTRMRSSEQVEWHQVDADGISHIVVVCLGL